MLDEGGLASAAAVPGSTTGSREGSGTGGATRLAFLAGTAERAATRAGLLLAGLPREGWTALCDAGRASRPSGSPWGTSAASAAATLGALAA
jgi:hypothetical protein